MVFETAEVSREGRGELERGQECDICPLDPHEETRHTSVTRPTSSGRRRGLMKTGERGWSWTHRCFWNLGETYR